MSLLSLSNITISPSTFRALKDAIVPPKGTYQKLKLSNSQESVYCSKILDKDKPLIINAGIFKLIPQDEKICLEFIDNLDAYQTINSIETYLIKYLYEHSVDILGLQVSKQNISNLFKKIILLPKTLNDKPYLLVDFSKNLTVKFNNKLITNSEQVKILNCDNLSNHVNAHLKFKKLIFCKDSIILDVNCVKLNIFEEKEKTSNNKKLNSEFVSEIYKNNEIEENDEIEMEDSEVEEDEIFTCLDHDELLEANSMMGFTESSRSN